MVSLNNRPLNELMPNSSPGDGDRGEERERENGVKRQTTKQIIYRGRWERALCETKGREGRQDRDEMHGWA